MENKLDKLFRDKLEHHSVQPSANAWDKVAAGFPKKNNTIVWAWRIAAAVALMGTIGVLIFNALDSNEATPMAQDNTPKVETTPAADSKEQKVKQEVMEQSTQPVIEKKEKPVKKPVFNRPAQLVAEVKTEKMKEEIVPVTEVVTPTQPENTVATTEVTQPKVEPEKTTVIVYTLAAVESKPAEEPAKVKPLQRMLTFAKDVKGGETTLASVRNLKDNFFGADETTRTEKENRNN
jgi:outer membrane biosynthesis protein TonB